MTFSQFSEHLSKIEATAKRNEMTTLLVELLKEAPPSEIDKVVYLSLGQLAPLYLHKEFGLAEKMVIRAIARTYHKDESVVKDLYKKTGDLGITTQFFSSNHSSHSNHSHRSVSSVFSSLIAIAEEAGSGSQEKKLDRVATLLTSLNPESVRYVVRIIVDKLRLGFSDKTVLDALSVMTSGDKSDREKLESIYNVRPDVGWLAKEIKHIASVGSPHLPHIPHIPHLGIPVLPALCQRLPTTEEIVEKMSRPPTQGWGRGSSIKSGFRPSTQSRGRVPVGPRILDNVGTSSIEGSGGNVAVEPKWDGQRIQAHVRLNTNSKLKAQSSKLVEIKLFTRGLEDVTDMFPDLAESLKKLASLSQISISNLILDGEVVGVDPKTGRVLPFQTMITRKRKYGIAEHLKSVPIRYMVFDILSLNDESLMDKPFSKRREILESIFNHFNHSDHFSHSLSLAPQLVTNDPVKIRDFLKEQIDRGLEGIVAKQIDAPYSPGRTGFTWVKMKWEGDAKSGGLLDTIDCVVMGVYAGRGKRSSFGVGAFLVGIAVDSTKHVARSASHEPSATRHPPLATSYLTISKIGTGLTDEQWRKLKVESGKLKVESCPKEYDVPKELTPDAWLEPEIVVEIQADNITKSPLHTAGFALRFPRLVRYRTDKRPEQITTLKEVKRLYKLQTEGATGTRGTRGTTARNLLFP